MMVTANTAVKLTGHDFDEWWALAAGMVIGAAIASPPPRYETVYVGTTSYYYANGYYYTPAPAGGYVMAAPPVGVTVQQPPTQVVNVTVNNQDYGYSNGAYYEIQEPEEEGGDPSFKTGAVKLSVPSEILRTFPRLIQRSLKEQAKLNFGYSVNQYFPASRQRCKRPPSHCRTAGSRHRCRRNKSLHRRFLMRPHQERNPPWRQPALRLS